MPISLTQFFQLYNFQFLQYLSLLIGKKIEREESHAKAWKANISNAATHL